jgi:hypothetical protein
MPILAHFFREMRTASYTAWSPQIRRSLGFLGSLGIHPKPGNQSRHAADLLIHICSQPQIRDMRCFIYYSASASSRAANVIAQTACPRPPNYHYGNSLCEICGVGCTDPYLQLQCSRVVLPAWAAVGRAMILQQRSPWVA